jgi:primosomal protein N' (replication factor Y)
MKEGFSQELLQAIEEHVDRKEQVILFQNRRGYAPILKCRMCEWKSTCINCDVSLTFHQRFSEMKCHYCGYRLRKPLTCPACGTDELVLLGTGTEKIEEVIGEHLPHARVERFDYDTTRSRKNQERLLAEFRNGQIDILVGTQMITKGFDFENIALVGVVNADSLLSFPDFRAVERTFQLLMQVSGRAGRRAKRGKVLIQTFSVEHPVFREVREADYNAFYEREMRERERFLYPPFVHIITVWFRHKDFSRVKETANSFHKLLYPKLGKRLLGPVDPPIVRLRTQYQQVVHIKIEKKAAALRTTKQWIQEAILTLRQERTMRSVKMVIDVDPY